ADPQRAAAAELGEVAAGEVGRAADQLGQSRAEMVERVLRSLARGDGLGLRIRFAQCRFERLVETGRELAAHPPLELGRFHGILRGVSLEQAAPLRLARPSGLAR